MAIEQDIFGFDILMGEGTLVPGSPSTDLRYTGNVRSIIDTTRVSSTPAQGISPTRIVPPDAGAEFVAPGRIIIVMYRVGTLVHWVALGEGLMPEVCQP